MGVEKNTSVANKNKCGECLFYDGSYLGTACRAHHIHADPNNTPSENLENAKIQLGTTCYREDPSYRKNIKNFLNQIFG